MTEDLHHRGPDDTGYWDSGPVSLGHKRLSVIDLSPTGHQPMLSDDGRLAIVFNGEIYNWRELRVALERQGVQFRSKSDTEVLLAMYRQHGISMLDHLEGMFAFGLWDARANVLHLVRDRYGVKPLLYMQYGSGLLFASELRCFRHAGDLGPLDQETLGFYSSANYIPAPRTIWQKISRLEPAHRLEVHPDSANAEPIRWFDPVHVVDSTTPELHPSERDKALEKVLMQAVDIRLNADVPVGVFLSGGIDSGLVSALAMRRSNNVTTLSIAFPDIPAYDESARARATAQHLGTDHREIVVGKRVALEAVYEVLDRLDEPFADSSLIPSFIVSRAARSEVTVALSGDGGDELFGGYQKYLASRWATVPGVPAAASLSAKLLNWLPEDRTSRLLDQVRRVRRLADGSTGSLVQRQRNLVGLLDQDVSSQIYRRGEDSDPLMDRLRVEFSRTEQWEDEIQRVLMADIGFVLPFDMLEKVDRASMWNSLEVRSPFLDRRVLPVAFSYNGPEHVGLASTKKVLRRLARRLLPASVARGPKRGFGVPLGAWFTGPLLPLLRNFLDPAEIATVGLLDSAAIERGLTAHLNRTRDLSWELWNAVVLQAWARNWRT